MQDRLYGVDFSGGKKAGAKIWIAEAVPDGRGIVVERCAPATEFLHCAADRDVVLPSLRQFIAESENAAFGCDFPFSLPKELIVAESWVEFMAKFPIRYPSEEEFRENCLDAAVAALDRKELKRKTDIEAKAPFCAYNLRIFKQTYYGIRDVLRPLVSRNLVNVPPLHYSGDDATWVMEVCPASTLKASGLYGSYKDARGSPAARDAILHALEDAGRVAFRDGDVRRRVLADAQGDALDSVVAADATFRAIADPERIVQAYRFPYYLEAYIYV